MCGGIVSFSVPLSRGANHDVFDYFLPQGRKLEVHPESLFVQAIAFQHKWMVIPLEWRKD